MDRSTDRCMEEWRNRAKFKGHFCLGVCPENIKNKWIIITIKVTFFVFWFTDLSSEDEIKAKIKSYFSNFFSTILDFSFQRMEKIRISFPVILLFYITVKHNNTRPTKTAKLSFYTHICI